MDPQHSQFFWIRDGHACINASPCTVSASEASEILNTAIDSEQIHSILIKGARESSAPHYWTVEPWIQGLSSSSIQQLQTLVIDTPEQQLNRQFGVFIGDISEILNKNKNLTDLFVSGAFSLSSVSYSQTKRLHIANRYLTVDDLSVITGHTFPALETISIHSGDSGIALEPAFNTDFASILGRIETLRELYLDDWHSPSDILQALLESGAVEKFQVLHLDAFEFSDDPDSVSYTHLTLPTTPYV